ncbi:oxidoreductase [Catellatospora sp. TT07R-123]|uniref:NAD(P)/FAD-dependent oxidoreductase n=1 Tax=Catellatospora sp. TT07R-123 TaxID=2733863 RepID=UPI001B287A1A|nr:FAD-binding oxidoreductase [Catellatospora sp. TT07R-123]GHJ43220.1 oxidoreductase [Catellatospora sp. TT07R-123]
MTEPPWRAAPPEPPPRDDRDGADVVIVGAGLTGLSAALHLLRAEPGLDVLILDAGQPGSGASGHGTGLLGPRIGPPVDLARRRFGDDTARAVYAFSTAAVARVLALIAESGIDCDLTAGAQEIVARTEADAARLRSRARAYAELGIEVPLLPGSELAPYPDVAYLAGLRYPSAATLDPAALTRGLADAARAAGARIRPGTLVREVHPGRVSTSTGPVRARKILVAVNGYADHLRLPVGTMLPLRVHAIATAPLPVGVLDGVARTAVIEHGDLAPYYRLTPDRRLIAGGGRALLPARGDGLPPGPADDTRHAPAWRFLTGWLHTLHPALRDIEVTHRWSGRIAMTGDGLPVVGRAAPGVWYAGGCGGHGLALSVATGAYLAEHHLGDRAPGGAPASLPWHRDRAPRLPVGGLARPLLGGYLATLAARAERKAREGAGAQRA